MCAAGPRGAVFSVAESGTVVSVLTSAASAPWWAAKGGRAPFNNSAPLGVGAGVGGSPPPGPLNPPPPAP